MKSLQLERESDDLQTSLNNPSSDNPAKATQLPALLAVSSRLKRSINVQTKVVSDSKRLFVVECDLLRSEVNRLVAAKAQLLKRRGEGERRTKDSWTERRGC